MGSLALPFDGSARLEAIQVNKTPRSIHLSRPLQLTFSSYDLSSQILVMICFSWRLHFDICGANSQADVLVHIIVLDALIHIKL